MKRFTRLHGHELRAIILVIVALNVVLLSAFIGEENSLRYNGRKMQQTEMNDENTIMRTTANKVTCESCHNIAGTNQPVIIIIRNMNGMNTDVVRAGESYEVDVVADKANLGALTWGAVGEETGRELGNWHFVTELNEEKTDYLQSLHNATDKTLPLVQHAIWTAPEQLSESVRFEVQGVLSAASDNGIYDWPTYKSNASVSLQTATDEYGITSVNFESGRLNYTANLPMAGQYNAQVYSLGGQCVNDGQLIVSAAGQNYYSVDCALPSGQIYILKIFTRNYSAERKFYVR